MEVLYHNITSMDKLKVFPKQDRIEKCLQKSVSPTSKQRIRKFMINDDDVHLLGFCLRLHTKKKQRSQLKTEDFSNIKHAFNIFNTHPVINHYDINKHKKFTRN